jgi:hypothetical protein
LAEFEQFEAEPFDLANDAAHRRSRYFGDV